MAKRVKGKTAAKTSAGNKRPVTRAGRRVGAPARALTRAEAPAGDDAPGTKSPELTLELVWDGDFRFEASGRGGAKVVVDGDSAAGPSPMEALLAALGSCAATDVVDILRKGRQELHGLAIRLVGERREEIPRSFTRIRAEVRIAGPVERAKAERAVKLAFEKYCSVKASLDPAIPVEVDVRLEG